MDTKGCAILLREVGRQTGTKVVNALSLNDNCDTIVVKFDRHVKDQEDLLKNFMCNKQVIIYDDNQRFPDFRTCAVNWMCRQSEWVA